jgi:NAD(P)H-nitrite reductase large subunit
MRYLILGCGPAGIAAAKTIRKADKNASIVIATEEPGPPYLRPLLPDLITGEMDLTGIRDPQGEDLASKGIEVRHGKRATKVDAANRRVSFADGSEESFDSLLVATGGKPALPPVLRKSPGSVFPFDSLEDAQRIREKAKGKGDAVVYGPGFLGIVASYALRRVGLSVVWLQPDLPRIGYPISGELEASILDNVRNKGVVIRDGIDISEVVELDGGSIAVRTSAGDKIRCSMIVAATERLPSVEFLRGSGVKVGTGILVDDRLQTSAPNIYAAGDCAELRDKASGESRINFGWRSAVKQGQLAGENMAGGGKLFIGKQEDYFWLLFGSALADRAK